jgi:TrmH family RNA methyltransferase
VTADLALVRALRTRETRAETGWYAVEGARFVIAAADAGAAFVKLVVCEPLLESPMARMVIKRQQRAGVPIVEVGADDYATVSRLTDGTGRGVIAVLRQRFTAIDRIGAHDLWLAVEGARSSGNLGSLMRTCLAVRARGVIAIGDTDVHDPTCVRATMGALEALELARMPAPALAALARASRARLFGATPDGNHDFRDVSYGGAAVIVVGSERRGLSEPLRRACDVLVRIPMAGRVDSLNLAVAGSLILYEAFGHR